MNWAAGAKGISRSEWVEALLERAAARQALKEGAADEDILAMARAVAEESGR